MTHAPLYVHRPVLNAQEIGDWFRAQGFSEVVVPDDMHITQTYSKSPLTWEKVPPAPDKIVLPAGAGQHVKILGDKGAAVLAVASPALEARFAQFRECGASHDYDSYQPHVTIAYGADPATVASAAPFRGAIVLGPEKFAEIGKDWTPTMKATDPLTDELLARGLVINLPIMVKARPQEASGRRIVEVEASCEEVDSEGDLILQKALLDSASNFVANGCLDIDHISEFGYRLGIPDPASWIVGRPLEVKAIPGNRTSVVGEIRKALDGRHDPQRHRYDDFWASLQSNPPVQWFSSVFGYPKDFDDCSLLKCDSGATRFLVKSFDWRSLAFTRSPVNTSIKGAARVVTAKSFLALMAKNMGTIALPSSMDDVWKGRMCKACGVHEYPSTMGYRTHFEKCAGLPTGMADIFAHALMHKSNIKSFMPAAAE